MNRIWLNDMESAQFKIECLVFLETDAVIKNISVKIKKTIAAERQYYVQDVLLEIKTLLACLDYNPRYSDCLYCRRTFRRYLREYKTSFPCTCLFLHSQEAESGWKFWVNPVREKYSEFSSRCFLTG